MVERKNICLKRSKKIKTYFKKVRIYLEAVVKFEKKKKNCKQYTLRGGVGKVYWYHTEVVNDTSDILNRSII